MEFFAQSGQVLVVFVIKAPFVNKGRRGQAGAGGIKMGQSGYPRVGFVAGQGFAFIARRRGGLSFPKKINVATGKFIGLGSFNPVISCYING